MIFHTGEVFHFCSCKVCTPVKDKFAICVSSEHSLFFFINSVDEKRPYTYEENHVVYLEPHQINCLSHKSYINVSKIQIIEKKDFTACSKKCILTNAVWLQIKSKVNQDKLLPKKYKDIITLETKKEIF